MDFLNKNIRKLNDLFQVFSFKKLLELSWFFFIEDEYEVGIRFWVFNLYYV